MRHVGHVVIILLLVGGAFAIAQTPSGPTPGAKPDASVILAAAREALGGEKRLAAVRTFVATGRTRQVQGDNLVPIEFEINCELPDKYARRDEIPARESGPTTLGFNGDRLIQVPEPPTPPARPGGPPPPTAAQLEAGRTARAVGIKQDFARLALGMFAAGFSAYPLTFTYAGEAEAPQGRADALDVKGPVNLTMRLFVYKDSHLPVMVSWQAAAGGPGRGGPPGRGPGAPPAGPGQAPARGAEPGRGADAARGSEPARGADPARGTEPRGQDAARGPEPGRAAGPGPGPGPGRGPGAQVENRIYFADYRDVDGVKFPFRIRRAVGPDTIEETIFDRFRINAKIDARKFEVAR